MNTHSGKSQRNKSRSVAHEQSPVLPGNEPAFNLEDNRPEAIAQRKISEIARNRTQKEHAPQLPVVSENTSEDPVLKQEDLVGEDLLQGRFTIGPKQKTSEDKVLQARFKVDQRTGNDPEDPETAQFRLGPQKENKTGLPDQLKSGVEHLSGMDISDVKVHYNSDKPAQLQAHAYAQGTDIHIAPGQEKHLPHEAWHVVQQKQGRVKPTIQMKGSVQVNDDAGLEKEADVMGRMANSQGNNIVQRKTYSPIHVLPKQANAISKPVQREGYTFDEFIEKLQQELGYGICNALTAAWLAGQLNASAEDNTVGLTDENWDVVVALKGLLDNATSEVGYMGLDSRDVSWAFLPYLQLKGQVWLDDLPNKNLYTEAREFGRWIAADEDGYAPSGAMAEKTVEGTYAELTEAAIAKMVDDALEADFDLGTSFKGIVTIKASNSKDDEFHAGHEFAISHTASQDFANNQFAIYDQNSGITQIRIRTDDAIVDTLTDYIMERYINFPIRGSDTACFSTMIDYA